MIDLPASTNFGRSIPKARFYANLEVTPVLRRLFTKQINKIIWQSKIAPSTTNLAPGEKVQEIQVFLLQLHQRGLDEKVMALIDRDIPYHILFLLEYESEQQAWIAYKEANPNKPGSFKAGVYYHTEWLPMNSRRLKLEGLNMDSVYEHLIRQVAGERLVMSSETEAPQSVKEAIAIDEQRQKLQRQIAALERKIQNEKQFNLQVELSTELRLLQSELTKLG